MLLSKGLARLNSLLLCCLLLTSPFTAPPPAGAATRKGDKFLKEGQTAEAKGDYEKALELFEQALATDPRDAGYRIAVNRTRFQASQKIVDRGEKLLNQNLPEEALPYFQKAFALDPSSTIAEQRMRQAYELIKKNEALKKSGQATEDPGPLGATPADKVKQETEKRLAGLMDAPVLKPIQRQIVNLKLNNQPARVIFETIGKMTGINVLFDPDFISQNSGKTFPVDFQNTTLEEALDYLSILTKAYWKPISSNAIYLTLDNPQKRRDYEDYILKVFYLQHALEPQELNEIANAVRVVGECRKVVPYPAQMALMVRCTADQVALVNKIINDMDKPRAEVVLDVYVLEANRTRTRSLAATIANGVQAGIQQNISFTPRNPRLITGTPPPASENGGGTTTTTTTPANNLIALSQLGRISTNDFSVNLPGAFLQALLEDRQTRVLQNPQVRTVDNKKASLRIGDRYPYATGSLNTGGVGGGVGGIAPVVQTQFQFAEVGVNVDITPKIHGNEEISLRVEVEVSNIRDQVDIGGLRQPVIGQRKLGEDIRIKKGEVNVMGGLTTTNVSRNRRGIPGLIDIPGLSWLFGTDGRDQSDSELLIILVPHLVRAPELTDLNLRGISTGTDTTVKLTYLSKPEEAPESPAATPPMGSVPAAPVPAAPAPAAPAGGGAPAAAPPANFPVLVPTPQPATPQPPTQAPPAQPVPAQPVPLAQFPQTVTPRSDLSAVEMSAAANSINSRNASARIGRPPVLRNKLTLRPVEKEIFLSGPVNVLVDVEYAEDLASAPLLLEYDKQLLKLIAAAPGGLLGIDGAKEEVEVNLDQGKIHVKRPVGSGGVSGNGTLLKLTFASLAKGEAAIRVVTADMVNSRKEPLTGAPLPEIQVEIK